MRLGQIGAMGNIVKIAAFFAVCAGAAAQPYPNKPNLWQFIFRPAHAQRGNYQVTFTATDGTDTASASLPIRVMKSHHH